MPENIVTLSKRDRWYSTYNAVLGPLIVAMMGMEDDSLVIDLDSAHETASAAADRAHGKLED